MEPNNNQNQPMSTPQVQQPVAPQPVAPVETQPQTPQKSGGKGIILLIIILILVVGMVGYMLFAKNQLNYTKTTATNSTTVALPSYTPTPTVSVDNLEVASPAADIQELENATQGL